ncbi:MAG: hypothetical protein JSS82_00310 [Bacteroidetes bacterium]|nr:hypothetical protein [Bacteroidota bacterium]
MNKIYRVGHQASATLSSKSIMFFFAGKTLPRLLRYIPMNILKDCKVFNATVAFASRKTVKNDFEDIERAFKTDPISFAFPDTYRSCIPTWSLLENPPNNRMCLPLDVLIETVVDYELCGEMVAPNYKLLAVLIYWIVRYLYERQSNIVCTYDVLVNYVDKWMNSRHMTPRTAALPFWYGELHNKKRVSISGLDSTEWPLKKNWFQKNPREFMLQALRFGCTEAAGRSLVVVYDNVITDLMKEDITIDVKNLRIYWNHVHQLEAMLFIAINIMYRRLIKRKEQKRPLPLRKIGISTMCSEQLCLLSAALGYKALGETHGFPAAPVILHAGDAGTGKTQAVSFFVDCMHRDNLYIFSQQNNHKSNTRTRIAAEKNHMGIPRIVPRCSTILKTIFDHASTCGNMLMGLEDYGATNAIGLSGINDNAMTFIDSTRSKLLDVAEECKDKEISIFPTIVGEYNWPWSGITAVGESQGRCFLKDVMVAFIEESKLTNMDSIVPLIWDLVMCSEVCVMIFSGDEKQQPAIGCGDIYRSMSKAFPIVRFHHPHRSGVSELTTMCQQIARGDTAMRFENKFVRVMDYCRGNEFPNRETYLNGMKSLLLKLHIENRLTMMNTQIITFSNALCRDLGLHLGRSIRKQSPIMLTTGPVYEIGQKVETKKTIVRMDLYKGTTYVVRSVLHVTYNISRASQKTENPTEGQLRYEAAVQYVKQCREALNKQYLAAMMPDEKQRARTMLNTEPGGFSAEFRPGDNDRIAVSSTERAGPPELKPRDKLSTLPRECFCENPRKKWDKDRLEIRLSYESVREIITHLDKPLNPSQLSFFLHSIVPDTHASSGGGNNIIKILVLSVFHTGDDLSTVPKSEDVVLVPFLAHWQILKDATTISINSGQGKEYEKVIVVIPPGSKMTVNAMYAASTRVVNDEALSSDKDPLAKQQPVLFFVAKDRTLREILRNKPPEPLSMIGSGIRQLQQLPYIKVYNGSIDYTEAALLEILEAGKYGKKPESYKELMKKKLKETYDLEISKNKNPDLEEKKSEEQKKNDKEEENRRFEQLFEQQLEDQLEEMRSMMKRKRTITTSGEKRHSSSSSSSCC